MGKQELKQISLDRVSEKDVPKGGKELEELHERMERNGRFSLTDAEAAIYDGLLEEHLPCKERPDGSPRFGATGGGDVVRYKVGGGKRSAVYTCEGCGKTYDLTAMAEERAEAPGETDGEDVERGRLYGDKSMDEVEFLRFEEFLREYAPNGEDVYVSFMGTGLGNIVVLESPSAGVRCDVTDSDCW